MCQNMTNLQKILALTLLAGLAFGLGRYMTPNSIEYREVEVVKEVIKEVVKENIKKNTQTKTVETWHPDGTHTIETYVLNQDTIVIEKELVAEKEIRKEIEKIIESQKPNWILGVTYGNRQDYGATVDRRILGPVFLGAYAKSDRDIGIALKMEF